MTASTRIGAFIDPLLIAGNVTSWFTIFSQAATIDPRYGWYSGSGGDGVSTEPETFVLLGLGCLTIAAIRVRR